MLKVKLLLEENMQYQEQIHAHYKKKQEVSPFYKQLLYFAKTVERFYIVMKHTSRVPTPSNEAGCDDSPQGHMPQTSNGQWLITKCTRKEKGFLYSWCTTIFKLHQNMSDYHREMSDNYMWGIKENEL
jgi:hypothetical protein